MRDTLICSKKTPGYRSRWGHTPINPCPIRDLNTTNNQLRHVVT